MAKKRNHVPDSEVPATGAAQARVRRNRGRHTAAPGAMAPETAAPASWVEPAVAASANAPEYEEIARLAYSFWEARGGEGGSAEEDWLRAEQELRAGRPLHAGA